MNNCPIISHTPPAPSTQWMIPPPIEWGRGTSPRFHIIAFVLVSTKRIRRQGDLKISFWTTSSGNLLREGWIYNSVKHQRRSSSAKTANGLNTLTASAKKLRHRPPTGFQMRIQPGVCCKCSAWVDCKCMKFVAADWCTRKWLKFNQTIRNPSSCHLRIPLVVTRYIN